MDTQNSVAARVAFNKLALFHQYAAHSTLGGMFKKA